PRVHNGRVCHAAETARGLEASEFSAAYEKKRTRPGQSLWEARTRREKPSGRDERMRRIGVLMNLTADDIEGKARLTALTLSLQELGWSEGRNLRIEYRWGQGMPTAFAHTQRNWLRLRPM